MSFGLSFGKKFKKNLLMLGFEPAGFEFIRISKTVFEKLFWTKVQFSYKKGETFDKVSCKICKKLYFGVYNGHIFL